MTLKKIAKIMLSIGIISWGFLLYVGYEIYVDDAWNYNNFIFYLIGILWLVGFVCIYYGLTLITHSGSRKK